MFDIYGLHMYYLAMINIICLYTEIYNKYLLIQLIGKVHNLHL